MFDKDGSEYHTEIALGGTSPGDFNAFIDDVSVNLPDAVCVVQDKPLMGEPYVIVQVKQDYGFYPLIVEWGYSLYIGDERTWVALSTDIGVGW